MKNKVAKFAVFQISETGSDSLYASRDLKGKPLMTFSDAVALKQHFHDTAAGNNSLNLIVRSLESVAK